MNSSINQTLSRTNLTSTVTLIPILCLFFFGGAVLRDFSLAIIVGAVVGPYSSFLRSALSRTSLTSTVTLIPILCLFFFGGAVLRDFSLAIIVGVVVGTYSSIFIASPIVLWWTRASGGSKSSLRREITQKAAANPAAS